MKTFKNTAAQGELGFIRLSKEDVYSPTDLKKLKKHDPETINKKSFIVVGHSETGHHHVMDADTTELYRLPESLTNLLVVKEPTTLNHLRDYDTHEPIRFEPGQYKVRTLQEFDIPSQQARASYD